MKEIGTKLQQARLEKGFQLDEIVHHTHIQLGHLQKIENGQFDFLPRPYVTAFIKTFAQYVGLNGESLIQRWREKEAAEAEALHLQQQETQEAARPRNDARPLTAALKPKALATAPATTTASVPFSLPYLKELGLGLGIILVMAALVFLMPGSKPEPAPTPAADNGTQVQKVEDPAQMTENPFAEVSQQAQQAAALKAPEPQPLPANLLTLQAQFENQTSMRVVTDGRDTTNTIYKAGDTQTYQAKEKFNLRIRTGGSVTLVLAGKNLGTFGQIGKVVLLTITSAGVTEQRVYTPQPLKPPSALPLDTLSIRRPRRLN